MSAPGNRCRGARTLIRLVALAISAIILPVWPALCASSVSGTAGRLLPEVSAAPPILSTGESYRLWDHRAPGATDDTPANTPMVTLFRPPEGWANGTAVVIAPGGAYMGLSGILEGTEPASWFTTRGVTAFVLTYRVAPNRPPVMFADGTRAIQFVRAHAAEFKVDPHRIGMMGFSAGGHLAATTALAADAANARSADLVERSSSRPDFLILAYPWLEGLVARADGQSSYCDFVKQVEKEPCDSATYSSFVPLRAVHTGAPPTFIFHTADDELVPVEGSLRFALALRAAKVPVELHVFEHGRHGAGLGGYNPSLSEWPTLLQEWLRKHGLLPPPAEGQAFP